jgi:hypothetical protein
MEILTSISALNDIAFHTSICNVSTSLNFEQYRPYLLVSLVISSLTQVRITGTAFSMVTDVLTHKFLKPSY